jgi:hypothetical protein
MSELLTTEHLLKVSADKTVRIAALEAQLRAIREVIPMTFLQRNDAPGAAGPTENLDLVGAVREMVSQSRKWEARARDLP